MRVSGLDDKEMDNYFIAMMTGKEMRPSIEGSGQSRAEGLKQGLEKGLGQIGIAAGLSLEKIESIRHR